ncbi:MAG: hypothetical protein RL266_1360 [Bacteroidota bacterium]|jgi:hypothetical protein
MKRLVLSLLLILASLHCCLADESRSKQDQHIEVSLRMVGHQVLLSLGDSTSRVLPIEQNGDTYRIRFDSEFGFNPDRLASSIDSVIFATGIAKRYIVEFRSCGSDLVVHSYEIGNMENPNVLACGTRDQPKACYDLVITILESSDPVAKSTEMLAGSLDDDYSDIYNLLALLTACGLAIAMVIRFILKQTRIETEVDPNIIPIGEYKFNKRKMELWFRDERIELTSKECDLLQLLCDSTNNTVERETILKMVWGDEGDYVGRTLDVFISKLRKKLEGDSNVRIANIRGIGYKLVIDP